MKIQAHHPTFTKAIDDIVAIVQFGIPISIVLGFQASLGAVDTYFASHLGHIELAAVSISNSIFGLPFTFGVGIVLAFSVKAAQAIGASDVKSVHRYVKSGLVLSMIVGLLLAIPLFQTDRILAIFNHKESLYEPAQRYLNYVSLSLPFQVSLILIRDFHSINDKPWISVPPIAFIALLNVALDYIFVNNLLGLPVSGVAGIGLSTLICSIMIYIWMLAPIWREIGARMSNLVDQVSRNDLMIVANIGLPISLSMLLQSGYYAVLSFIISGLGTASLSAKHLLFQLFDTAHFLVFGVSIAASIFSGRLFGANGTADLRSVLAAGLVVGAIIAAPFCLAIAFLLPEWIGLFSDSTSMVGRDMLSLAFSIRLQFIIFLVFDIGALMVAEVLRGLSDTKFCAVVVIVLYWLIGVPIILLHQWLGYGELFLFIWSVATVTSIILFLTLLMRWIYLLRVLSSSTSDS